MHILIGIVLAIIVILRTSLGSATSDKFQEKRIRYQKDDSEKGATLKEEIVLSNHSSD